MNLIECDDKYADVFAFVFGSTVVFESLAEARRNMGKFRMVTLEGEILESTGAMTGGSLRQGGAAAFWHSPQQVSRRLPKICAIASKKSTAF